jgi:hypothetical protein
MDVGKGRRVGGSAIDGYRRNNVEAGGPLLLSRRLTPRSSAVKVRACRAWAA